MDELGIDFGETSKDGMFTLEASRCLGTCGLAPVVMIDDEVHAQVTPDQVPALLERYIAKAREEKEGAPAQPGPPSRPCLADHLRLPGSSRRRRQELLQEGPCRFQAGFGGGREAFAQFEGHGPDPEHEGRGWLGVVDFEVGLQHRRWGDCMGGEAGVARGGQGGKPERPLAGDIGIDEQCQGTPLQIEGVVDLQLEILDDLPVLRCRAWPAIRSRQARPAPCTYCFGGAARPWMFCPGSCSSRCGCATFICT